MSEVKGRPLVPAPSFQQFMAAARVICRWDCPAAHCAECRPGFEKIHLARLVLIAAGVMQEAS